MDKSKLKKIRRTALFLDKEEKSRGDELMDKMISYAIKQIIDGFVDSYKTIVKAKQEQETARVKAEEALRVLKEKEEAEKRKIKFGKLEFHSGAFGSKGAKFIIPAMATLGTAVSVVAMLMRNLDNARRVSGEVRRWNERLDKRRLIAEKRRQEEWAFKKEKLESQENAEGLKEQPKRRRGRPRKGT
jgi:hypothetical protein